MSGCAEGARGPARSERKPRRRGPACCVLLPVGLAAVAEPCRRRARPRQPVRRTSPDDNSSARGARSGRSEACRSAGIDAPVAVPLAGPVFPCSGTPLATAPLRACGPSPSQGARRRHQTDAAPRREAPAVLDIPEIVVLVDAALFAGKRLGCELFRSGLLPFGLFPCGVLSGGASRRGVLRAARFPAGAPFAGVARRGP